MRGTPLALAALSLLQTSVQSVPYAQYERFSDVACTSTLGVEVERMEVCAPLGQASSHMLQKSQHGMMVVNAYYNTPNCSGAYSTGTGTSTNSEIVFLEACHEKKKLIALGTIPLSATKDAILGKYKDATCTDDNFILGMIYHPDTCILHSTTTSSQRQGWVKGSGIVTWVYPNPTCAGNPAETHAFLSDVNCDSKMRLMEYGFFGNGGAEMTAIGTPITQPLDVPMPTPSPTLEPPTMDPTRAPTKPGETYAPSTPTSAPMAPTKRPTSTPTDGPTTASPTVVRIIKRDDSVLLGPDRESAIIASATLASVAAGFITLGVLACMGILLVTVLKIKKRWALEDEDRASMGKKDDDDDGTQFHKPAGASRTNPMAKIKGSARGVV